LSTKVEEIYPKPSLLVEPPRMSPESVADFSTLLFSSYYEFQFRLRDFFMATFLGDHTKHVIDVANTHGFYFASDEHQKMFKLVYPKIVLNALPVIYKDIPIFQFIGHLFYPMEASVPVSRGFIFEIMIALVLFLKLASCHRVREISIFEGTLVEDYVIQKGNYLNTPNLFLPQSVPLFSSNKSGEVSSAGRTYHLSAWNSFFNAYLSKRDGIFIPTVPHFRGQT
jgi:hypothetical protein